MMKKFLLWSFFSGIQLILPAQSSEIYEVIQAVNFRKAPSTTTGEIYYKLQVGEQLNGISTQYQKEKETLWLDCTDKAGKRGYVAIESRGDIYLKKSPYKEKARFFCPYFMFSDTKDMVSDMERMISLPKNREKEVEYIIKDIFYIGKINLDIACLDDANLLDNCAAVRYLGKKYIVFNNAFFSKLSQSYSKPWPVYAVLAHEIAHHANDHINRDDPSYQQELDADLYAGFILKSIGLDEEELEKSLKFMDDYPNGGGTHPPLAMRKETIRRGWRETPEMDHGTELRKKFEGVRYRKVYMFKNGFARVEKDGKFGFINAIGREIIPPIYEEAEDFSANRLVRVKDSGGKFHYITPTGKER